MGSRPDPKGPKDPNMECVGFLYRNRNYGFGYIPSIWVLGPLGRIRGMSRLSRDQGPCGLNLSL